MMVVFGKFSWMSGIWGDILTSFIVLGLVVSKATVGVAAVGALPLGFQVKLGLVRGKFLPAGFCWPPRC